MATRLITFAPAVSVPSLVIIAARCWRKTRDTRRSPQPALYAALTEHRCGTLAPAFDGLLRIYEACTGRLIRIGGTSLGYVSADEQRLIKLLEMPKSRLSADETRRFPRLVPTMRIALQTTKLMLRQALPV